MTQTPDRNQLALDADKFRSLVDEAMNYAWGDWCGDTGCFPSDFEWRGGNGTLSFTAGKWAGNVADYIFNSQMFKAALTAQPVTDDVCVIHAWEITRTHCMRCGAVGDGKGGVTRAATAPKCDALELVRLLLPLAKGYVAAHPGIASTKAIIADAEQALAAHRAQQEKTK